MAKKSTNPLNVSQDFIGTPGETAVLENHMDAESSQVSQSELPALIRSIMREEIGAAFDKLPSQFDTLKTELSTCGQRLSEMEVGLESLDSRAA